MMCGALPHYWQDLTVDVRARLDSTLNSFLTATLKTNTVLRQIVIVAD